MAFWMKQQPWRCRPARSRKRGVVLRLETLEARACPSTTRAYDSNGDLTQIEQTNGSLALSDVWNYAPYPTLTSIVQNTSSNSTTTWNYPVNSIDTITQTDTNLDGASEDFLWKPGFASETDLDAQGNVTLETQVVYNNGGSTASISQTQNNPDGSSVKSEWDHNADGSFDTISQKDYAASGAVVEVQTWNYSGGNLSFYEDETYNSDGSTDDAEVVVNPDGSIVVGMWSNGVSSISLGATGMSTVEVDSYNAAGAQVQQNATAHYSNGSLAYIRSLTFNPDGSSSGTTFTYAAAGWLHTIDENLSGVLVNPRRPASTPRPATVRRGN